MPNSRVHTVWTHLLWQRHKQTKRPQAKEGSGYAWPQTGTQLTRAIQNDLHTPLTAFVPNRQAQSILSRKCLDAGVTETTDLMRFWLFCFRAGLSTRQHAPHNTNWIKLIPRWRSPHQRPGLCSILKCFGFVFIWGFFLGLAPNGITTGAVIYQKQVRALNWFIMFDLQRRCHYWTTAFSFISCHPPASWVQCTALKHDYPHMSNSCHSTLTCN